MDEANTMSAPEPEVYAAMERILQSEQFESSQRYSNLLRYIVQCSLHGDAAELKERIIGIEVFGRRPDYDTATDPTVRVAMNEVRKRLAQYYSQSGAQDALRIEIPIGSYVAKFIELEEGNLAQAEPNKAASSRKPALWMWLVAAAIAISILAFWAGPLLQSMRVDPLWKPLVKGNQALWICIGSSPEAGANPQEAAPASGSASDATQPEDEFLRVGMTDVHAAEVLGDYLKKQHQDSQIHPTPGRDLGDADENSVVLLGRYLNEWKARLRNDLRYTMHSDQAKDLRWIEDASAPGKRDWSVHLEHGEQSIDTDYVLITRTAEETTGKWSLGVAGLTGKGTWGAIRLLTDGKSLKMIEERLPAGWEKKNVQIVLEIHLARKVVGATRVVSTAVW